MSIYYIYFTLKIYLRLFPLQLAVIVTLPTLFLAFKVMLFPVFFVILTYFPAPLASFHFTFAVVPLTTALSTIFLLRFTFFFPFRRGKIHGTFS